MSDPTPWELLRDSLRIDDQIVNARIARINTEIHSADLAHWRIDDVRFLAAHVKFLRATLTNAMDAIDTLGGEITALRKGPPNENYFSVCNERENLKIHVAALRQDRDSLAIALAHANSDLLRLATPVRDSLVRDATLEEAAKLLDPIEHECDCKLCNLRRHDAARVRGLGLKRD